MSQQSACNFDRDEIRYTLDAFDRAITVIPCPHIGRLQPQSGGAACYLVLDANCHDFDYRQRNGCQKSETSELIICAKGLGNGTSTGFRRESTIPRNVTFELEIDRTDLIEFPDGVRRGTAQVLDLYDQPLVIYPHYDVTKAGELPNDNCDHHTITISRRCASHLQRALIIARVRVWKRYFADPIDRGEPYHQVQTGHISVAIPECEQPAAANELLRQYVFDSENNEGETKVNKRPLNVFLSYAHEDRRLKNQLVTALRGLSREYGIQVWNDQEILPGNEWEAEIAKQLEQADIILLLISSDFINSEFIYQQELKQAMKRHENKEARVVPIILRPCDWRGQIYGKLQALPEGVRPVTKWSNRDEAFTAISQELRKVMNLLLT